MDLSKEILSDIIVHMKYAKYLPEKLRRETWSELVCRNKEMHQKKYPQIHDEIEDVYNNFVLTKKVLPSMRSFQFAGKPIELNQSRIFNCSFLHINHSDAFSEVMFLLLGGIGVGYSVQSRHIQDLPLVQGPKTRNRRFIIGDSIEGWADAIKVLVEAYFYNKSNPVFIYDDIRPKGARLVTSGGKAPGPQPLKDCIYSLTTILDGARGRQLRSLEVHDIICHIADAVLAGGIRRAALISLFDKDDEDMLTCKSGNWWETHGHRGRANNSAVFVRGEVTKEEFLRVWKATEVSMAGEPGIFWTNDPDMGTNPCCVSGDTMVLTSEGRFRADELVGKKFKAIIEGNEYDSISNGFWKTGTKQVYEVVLKSGHKVKTTSDHRFFTPTGWKQLKVLELGDFVKVNKGSDGDTNKESPDFKDGWLIGNLLGDGTFSHQDGKNDLAYLCYWGEQQKMSEMVCGFLKESDKVTTTGHLKLGHQLKNGDKTVISSTGLASFASEYGISVSGKCLNSKIFTSSRDFKAGFLSGWFDADGSVQGNLTKGSSIRLWSVEKKNLEIAQLLLSDLGIESKVFFRTVGGVRLLPKNDGSGELGEYNCKDGYELIISRRSMNTFRQNVSFLCKEKREKLESLFLDRKRDHYQDSGWMQIASVTPLGEEDVYDVTIDTVECFDGNGIVLHNCEIGLFSNQMCNLTETDASDADTQEELNARARAAAFIGTLQAGYTDFHYLRECWRRQTEKEALLGVSMTGIASGAVLGLDLEQAAEVVKQENARVAKLIGIKKAARTCAVKPAGSTSLVLGSSSGIHAWHNDYYIRRVRVGKNEAIYKYISQKCPSLVVDDLEKPHLQSIFEFPQKAPEGAILRSEDIMDYLERIKKFNVEWIKTGHRTGANRHNVSATINVKNGEWEKVGEWMWENQEFYTGLSAFPYFGGTYAQAPFEDITEEKYLEMYNKLKEINLAHVVEMDDTTDLAGEIACAGGACEVL